MSSTALPKRSGSPHQPHHEPESASAATSSPCSTTPPKVFVKSSTATAELQPSPPTDSRAPRDHKATKVAVEPGNCNSRGTDRPLHIVFACIPVYSELLTLLTVAEALTKRGHCVSIALHDVCTSWVPWLKETNASTPVDVGVGSAHPQGVEIRLLKAGGGPDSNTMKYLYENVSIARTWRGWCQKALHYATFAVTGSCMTTRRAGAFLALQTGLCEAILQVQPRPDVIVSHVQAYSGFDAADILGIPAVVLLPAIVTPCAYSPNNLALPCNMFHGFPACMSPKEALISSLTQKIWALDYAPFMPDINKHRARYGLRPMQHLWDYYADKLMLTLGCPPVTLPYALSPLVHQLGYLESDTIRPAMFFPGKHAEHAALRDWLDSYSCRVVFLSMGTTSELGGWTCSIMDALLEGVLRPTMGGANTRLLLAMDSKAQETLLPPWAAENSRVRVEAFVPQRAVLNHPAVEVFITHGGCQSVLESLELGVPMLVVPQLGDQPYHAQRVVEMGAGLMVRNTILRGSEGVTAAARAVHDLLQNPNYKKAARAVSKHLRAAGGAVKGAQLIESAAMGEFTHLSAPNLAMWWPLRVLGVDAVVCLACGLVSTMTLIMYLYTLVAARA
jgi:UDP:flavonoid glycosyltransferase YjiC (YdhE family)